MQHNKSNSAKTLSYLLIGGGIGATLALLFAPKSGSEFRHDISNAANSGLEKTKEKATQLRDSAGEYYETAKDKAGEVYSTTTEKVNQFAETASNKFSQLTNTASDTANEVTADAKKLSGNISKAVEEKVNQAENAFDAGKKEFNKPVNKTPTM